MKNTTIINNLNNKEDIYYLDNNIYNTVTDLVSTIPVSRITVSTIPVSTIPALEIPDVSAGNGDGDIDIEIIIGLGLTLICILIVIIIVGITLSMIPKISNLLNPDPQFKGKGKEKEKQNEPKPIEVLAYLIRNDKIGKDYAVVCAPDSVRDSLAVASFLQSSKAYPSDINVMGKEVTGSTSQIKFEKALVENNAIMRIWNLPREYRTLTVPLRNGNGARIAFRGLEMTKGFHSRGQPVILDETNLTIQVQVVDWIRIRKENN